MIGAGSIVTRKIPNNVVAVGTPARVIRKHVAWERIHLGADAPFYKPDASTVKKSKYWNLTLETGAPERRTLATRVRRRLGREWIRIRNRRCS
ncbi:hypothetical protein [Microbacterium elymi]|uniref:Acetyltransferase n=1 Tax=Microbacterium elymi TaxID=2909587 RepID=A0ABY5NKQ3_9MICO|nr:hypothetical protein [Microbacterium elymi]UUT35749.1 hypothetical protein L2X98_21250 [Microbacterium elymi]